MASFKVFTLESGPLQLTNHMEEALSFTVTGYTLATSKNGYSNGKYIYIHNYGKFDVVERTTGADGEW